ncbi:MAG TPA: hypothetical protein VLV78_21130 [Thermoanaerobaculia bacterium]|nr:hypothetical protein [Thermoanaerobaculia bacterium]
MTPRHPEPERSEGEGSRQPGSFVVSTTQDDGSAWARHRFALVLVAVLVAMLIAPALIQREVFTFRDHSDYFQPLRYYTTIHIRSFLLPYWNPYSASGEPWLANPQTGVFYPPTWLFIVLPFETAYMLYLALHLLILGWGAYLLFARFASSGAALTGAAIVMFCGPTLSLVDISNNLATFAWVPLVLWCAVSKAEPELAALVLAMAFLGGEPFFATIAALLYVIVVRDVQKILIAGAGAFGLSAIQLLPFLEMIRGSDRAAGLAPEQIFRESMRAADWLRVAVPPKFTAPLFDPALSQHFIPVIYVGIPAALLAAAALVFRRGRTPWLLLLLFSILVASGNRLPVIGELFARLPLTLFRYPSRVVPFGALAIAALAAMGWDRLRPSRRWVDLVLILIILADLLPRERRLFDMAPFRTNLVPYSDSIGRIAKVLRINEKPITNRSAWMAGYLNLYQRRFDASTAAPVANERYLRLHDAAIARGREELLNLIGAGFILSDHPLALRPIKSVGPVTVYWNSGAPPMVTFWSRAVSFSSPDQALQESIDHPDRAALFVWPPVDARYKVATPLVISAASIYIDTRHARAIVEAPTDGIAMLTQQDFPGWRVFVDGVEKPKLLGAGVFRAVEVKKGHHEIIWRYDPKTFFAGMCMTFITAASLQVNRFVKRRRARKFS